MKYTEESYNKIISELFSRHPSIQKVGFAPGAYKPGLDVTLGNSTNAYMSPGPTGKAR